MTWPRKIGMFGRGSNRLSSSSGEWDMENAELRLEVAKLRKAIFDTHKNRVRHVDCRLDHCHICDGGLFVCADCGTAEAEASERACTGAPTSNHVFIEATKQVSDQPVPSHGGPAKAVTWLLLINGVVIEREYSRYNWNYNVDNMENPLEYKATLLREALKMQMEDKALAEPVEQDEPYGFAYEHDGVIYDSKCPPVFAKAQQPESMRQEPWTEIPLFTRNKRWPNK